MIIRNATVSFEEKKKQRIILFSYYLARRLNQHAKLQSSLSARELPIEILFLSRSFMATIVLCS